MRDFFYSVSYNLYREKIHKMKHKITFLFLFAGIIIYANTIGSTSASNIMLSLICICLFIMLKQREKVSALANTNKNELLNIINAIPMPAFLKDLDGNIFAANKSLFKLFQLNEKTDYKTITEIISKYFDLKNSKEEEIKLKEYGSYINSERLFKIDKGIKKYCIYKAGLYNNKKILTNIAVFIKNIEIDSDNCRNEDMIATLTHDLKTPAVAQIRGIELLLNGSLGEINEKQRNFLNDILQSGNYMLSMLIDMLWLYKCDNKKITLNITSFDINELIKDILKENKLLLNIKHSNFIQINKTARIHVLADKSHIKRIIHNILINAVMHSIDSSDIFINTSIENGEFIFKVTNKGNHIDENLLKCIFDKNSIFKQKSEGLSTGLGLYLSNSLLELNGGKFICNSTIDGDNTFGFSINLCNPAIKLNKDIKSAI